MKSTQRRAPLRVMPCLESHFHVLANAEHVKQNCQLFNMNRRMYGVTWGVDRGRLSLGQIGGTTLMWVCGPAELSKVHWVICKNNPTPPSTHHSFIFLSPPSQCWASLHPLCPASFSPLTHTPSLHLWFTHIEKPTYRCTHAYTHSTVHAHVHTHTVIWKACFLCPLTKQEQAALVTDNKVVNSWFWRNSVVAVSHE